MAWSDADEEFACSMIEGLQQELVDLDLKWKRSTADRAHRCLRWRLSTEGDERLGDLTFGPLHEVCLQKVAYPKPTAELPEPIAVELSHPNDHYFTNPVLRRMMCKLSFGGSLNELWGKLVYAYQQNQASIEDFRRQLNLDVSPGWLECEYHEDLAVTPPPPVTIPLADPRFIEKVRTELLSWMSPADRCTLSP
jgi:hypothetical protein